MGEWGKSRTGSRESENALKVKNYVMLAVCTDFLTKTKVGILYWWEATRILQRGGGGRLQTRFLSPKPLTCNIQNAIAPTRQRLVAGFRLEPGQLFNRRGSSRMVASSTAILDASQRSYSVLSRLQVSALEEARGWQKDYCTILGNQALTSGELLHKTICKKGGLLDSLLESVECDFPADSAPPPPPLVVPAPPARPVAVVAVAPSSPGPTSGNDDLLPSPSPARSVAMRRHRRRPRMPTVVETPRAW